MCIGGSGGGKGYDAYKGGNHSDFAQFEKKFEKYTDRSLKKADHDKGYARYVEIPGRFERRATKLGRDPRAAMELEELKRQYAVDLGQVGIDKNFDKFDKKYYGKYRDTYKGYYAPQVEKQYGEATDKLVASLADRGMLESSVGNDAQAKLLDEFTKANTNISNEALDASNKLRSNVESQKSNLYSINEASADPMGINAQAIGASTALVAPPTYSPLGQLFTAALQPFMNFQQSSASSPTRTYTSPYSNTNGSGTVVG